MLCRSETHGESGGVALTALKDWVAVRVGEQRQASTLAERVRRMEMRRVEAQRGLTTMIARWQQYRTFLLQQGVAEADIPREPYWGAGEDGGPTIEDDDDDRYEQPRAV